MKSKRKGNVRGNVQMLWTLAIAVLFAGISLIQTFKKPSPIATLQPMVPHGIQSSTLVH